ncbi:MAG: cobalamin-dependent protein [Oscillochloridaceae bacterium]|nr:cobalamin-dependent protein [Chloroflexaceae bacterium]MDW8388701.1 cobalamin-dependent protein [Oscillochloridaceae bacterium]
MTTPATSAARGSGPSLMKLVQHIPETRRWRRQADALIVIGRQFELMAQERGVEAHVALGTLRFSLFHLHQGRIAQLAPLCRSVTVYGEADVEPPKIPHVTFVPMPAGSPLSQEWFLIVDSPVFWASMISRVSVDRANSAARRYQFEGVLTAEERVVSRASLLLSLARGQAPPEAPQRDPVSNAARWARIAYALASHSEAQRLKLVDCLGELPELQSLLAESSLEYDQMVPLAMDALRRFCGTVGELLYRYTDGSLVPVAWSAASPPPPHSLTEGLVGQAFQKRQLAMQALVPTDPEYALLGGAASALAIPISARGQPWGVLLIGQAEPDPHEAEGLARAVGLATLLEQLIDSSGESAGQPAPRAPAARKTAFGATAAAAPFGAAPFGPGAPAPAAAAPFGPGTPAPTAAPFANGGLNLPGAEIFGPGRAAEGFAAAPAPGSPAAAPSLAFSAISAASAPLPGPSAPSFGLPTWLPPGAAEAATGGVAAGPAVVTPGPQAGSLPPSQGFPIYQRRLLGALVAFDQNTAEEVWREAGALYPAEALCTELLMPVQVAIGEGWHRGEVSVAMEHFASRFVESKLHNLFTAHRDNPHGPLAVIGCAQGELHELGPLTVALFLKWAGFRVNYLGQTVPNSTLESLVRTLRPQILGLSATTVEAAHHLTEAGQILSRIEPPRPLFIFGGMAFFERPDLRARVQGGQYMDGDPRSIARRLAAQFIRG